MSPREAPVSMPFGAIEPGKSSAAPVGGPSAAATRPPSTSRRSFTMERAPTAIHPPPIAETYTSPDR